MWIRVTRRRFRMVQDSDDPLFVVNIVVWVLVVILASSCTVMYHLM